MKLILLNGPPRSGKDTATTIIKKYLSCQTYRMSAPIKASINKMFDLSGKDLLMVEKFKDDPLPIFNSHTYRQIQIAQFLMMEKLFGASILGDLAVIKLKDSPARVIVIPDIGRSVELGPLFDTFGSDPMYIIQISRPDHDYSNDIRHDVDTRLFKPSQVASINNKYDTELYEAQVVRILSEWELIK